MELEEEQPMYRQLPLSTVIALLIVSGGSALGQGGGNEEQQPGVVTQVQIGGKPMKISIKGADLPQYTVVSMFFLRSNKYVQETNSDHKRFLLKLGVEHGSPAEEFLAETSKRAVEIILTPDFDASLKGEEYRRHQFETLKMKARNLGKLYQGLLDGLDEAGVDPKKVVQYCEKEVRPNVSASDSGDTFEMFMTAVAEFDKQLTRD